jgi:hypothetical protein
VKVGNPRHEGRGAKTIVHRQHWLTPVKMRGLSIPSNKIRRASLFVF